MMAFSNQEMEEFKVEALELLEAAEKSLLALDQGTEFRPAFDTVFRSFHNLKGAAGMMDLVKLQAHVHELESVLMQFKESTSIPKVKINLFLLGIDAARTLLEGKEIQFKFESASAQGGIEVRASSEENRNDLVNPLNPTRSNVEKSEVTLIPDSAISEFVAESEELINRISDALQTIEANLHSQATIEALYRDIHSLKGSAYLFSYNSLGDISHAIESSLEKTRSEASVPTKQHLNILFRCVEVIEREVEGIKTKTKNEKLSIAIPLLIQSLNSEFAKKMVQIDPAATALQTPLEKTPQPGELKIEQKQESLQEKPKMKLENVPTMEVKLAEAKDKENEHNGSIRVSVALLDNLMTLMGEMVLVRNQVLQFSSESEDLEFLNLSKRLNVVTSEIQGEMMKTRMQPIGNILSKFNRVVRDLSIELKKEINLKLAGADTELDRSLLEAIKDPLTHIVRNSCDHGIETPEVRQNSGKSKTGNISIRSYHESGQVVIEVSDDGKGLHKDVILKKGLEKGLITQGQSVGMSEKEIFNLIFAPGFSTAASITNVSGRGVGMDVVRTNVERIGGSVELCSVASKGTTIKIKIPLTLAIVPALIVKCDNGTYAIPQVKLEELVRVDQSSAENKIEYLHGAPVYRLRGNILPLVYLSQIIGLPSHEIVSSTAVKNIAVLNANQCAFGLIVDEIQDTADIVVKPINRLLKTLQVYSGATILGDGSIALILDVAGISKVAQIGNESSKPEESAGASRLDSKAANESQEFLIVRVQSPTKHAIVLNYVHRLEEFKISNVEISGSQRVIRYGNTILPIISVNEQLGYKTSKEPKNRETISVVVIQKADSLYGLEVEEIVDTLSTDVEADTTLVKHVGIFGNLNTAQELIVAIDPFELIASAYPQAELVPVSTVIPSSSTLSKAIPKQRNVTGFAVEKFEILLVEDTVFFRKAVAAVLKKVGHNVTLAVDGKDALEIMEKQGKPFDLIISDIEMPRMNGFDLAKTIRLNPLYAKTPLLALSSRADQRYIEIGIQSGFDGYMEKLKPTLLLETISTLVRDKNGSAA